MTEAQTKKSRVRLIILAYPLGLILISAVVNFFLFDVHPPIVALPSSETTFVLAIASILLVLNHTWLMTSTELTRLQYGLHATPEEWESSGSNKKSIVPEGWEELERRHNAHRNATENTTHFVLLAVTMAVISPNLIAMQIWTLAFAVSRIGHSYSYIKGRDGLRGLFMSISLTATYGLASYVVISLVLSW